MNGLAPVVMRGRDVRLGAGVAAFFLDRDGVLVANRDRHVREIGDVALLPGVAEAIRRVRAHGHLPIIVTNQAIVGRGLVPLPQVLAVHRHVLGLLADLGAHIDLSYLCPHSELDGCGCRKPEPGMLLAAERDHGVDLSRSFLVGDALTDIEAARRAGVRAAMVRTGRGAAQEAAAGPGTMAGVPVSDDLAGAVDELLGGLGGGS